MTCKLLIIKTVTSQNLPGVSSAAQCQEEIAFPENGAGSVFTDSKRTLCLRFHMTKSIILLEGGLMSIDLENEAFMRLSSCTYCLGCGV